MSHDPYALSAEFYDVLSEQQWQARRAPILAALRRAAPSAGPVLDVGAGSGPCVQVIAEALPDVPIVAVEPSPAMRAALTCRIMADAGLRDRVTVLGGRLDEVALPPQLSAAVICGTIGYLDAAARRSLWRDLAARLPSGGVVVVDVMMLSQPQAVPLMKAASARIGEQEYEVWLEGQPGEGDVMRWRLTYRVLRDGTVQREFLAEHDWHTFGLDTVAAEAAEAGFAFEPLAEALIPAGLLRRS